MFLNSHKKKRNHSICLIQTLDLGIVVVIIAKQTLKMKLFQSIRQVFKTVGMCPSGIKHYQNWKIVSTFLFLTHTFITSMAYFLYDAKSIPELAEALFPSTTELVAGVSVGICIWKMTSILKLMKNFDDFIDKREWIFSPKVKNMSDLYLVWSYILGVVVKTVTSTAFPSRFPKPSISTAIHSNEYEN